MSLFWWFHIFNNLTLKEWKIIIISFNKLSLGIFNISKILSILFPLFFSSNVWKSQHSAPPPPSINQKCPKILGRRLWLPIEVIDHPYTFYPKPPSWSHEGIWHYTRGVLKQVTKEDWAMRRNVGTT